jgi:hypothetical protein
MSVKEGEAMLEGRKVLVTGATGQIAGPIAENFAETNEVWCAARFSDPTRKAQLEAIGVKTVAWDMDSGDMSALPDDFTHVVHSALHVSPDYDASITNNAEATALLMQHCRKANAFLHVSSTCVYKRHDDHPNHLYAESDRSAPISAPTVNKKSTPPNVSSADFASAATDSGSARSKATACAYPPAPRILFDVCRAGSMAMSPTTTRQPSAPSRTAVAAPIPVAPPATIATRPANPCKVTASHLCW